MKRFHVAMPRPRGGNDSLSAADVTAALEGGG